VRPAAAPLRTHRPAGGWQGYNLLLLIIPEEVDGVVLLQEPPRRDVSAAKRFFKKMMRADHRRLSLTIGTDKHASYPGFRPFHTAERTIEGIEAAHMMRKGQVKRLGGRDTMGRAKFVASLFGVAT
jgi:transposase-like protein